MDVICQAKSGMGKTAVFVLSTLQQIEPVAGKVAARVLCVIEANWLTRNIGRSFHCNPFESSRMMKMPFFHLRNVRKDLLKNECPHIVVGTPGRILGLAGDKDLGLTNVRRFILDECDKMLESLATLGEEIRPVCKKFMQDVIFSSLLFRYFITASFWLS
ncbi:hypothetical protein Vadar_006045 [Vaccinium darrowii]|uniref:Uncharacterized protein n=1 Tax=Vaccinium darrowii TaxID=229202 RepID=A0ACB7XNI3_9ERIC|nr:hypothetical protein Vadar_006045 [Vaccinium darrowii]